MERRKKDFFLPAPPSPPVPRWKERLRSALQSSGRTKGKGKSFVPIHELMSGKRRKETHFRFSPPPPSGSWPGELRANSSWLWSSPRRFLDLVSESSECYTRSRSRSGARRIVRTSVKDHLSFVPNDCPFPSWEARYAARRASSQIPAPLMARRTAPFTGEGRATREERGDLFRRRRSRPRERKD